MWHRASNILTFLNFTRKQSSKVANLIDCIQIQLWETGRLENWLEKESCEKMLTLKAFATNSHANDHSIFWTQCDSYLDYRNIMMFKLLAVHHSDSTWPGLVCMGKLNLVPQNDAVSVPTSFSHTSLAKWKVAHWLSQLLWELAHLTFQNIPD